MTAGFGASNRAVQEAARWFDVKGQGAVCGTIDGALVPAVLPAVLAICFRML